MSFELRKLGTFRIERTEDYDQCPFDRSYCELIRVKGSRPGPSFNVVSHVYKFSETELALYMKGKKNLWRALGKLLTENIDLSDDEIILRFQISKFPEAAKIVPFVRKRGSGKLSPELIARRDALNARRHTDKIGQTASRPPTKEGEGNSSSHTLSARLEDFTGEGLTK
jgi:hypothetical protein